MVATTLHELSHSSALPSGIFRSGRRRGRRPLVFDRLWVHANLVFGVRLCDFPGWFDWPLHAHLASEYHHEVITTVGATIMVHPTLAEIFQPSFRHLLALAHLAVFPPLLLSIRLGHYGGSWRSNKPAWACSGQRRTSKWCSAGAWR